MAAVIAGCGSNPSVLAAEAATGGTTDAVTEAPMADAEDSGEGGVRGRGSGPGEAASRDAEG